MVILLLLLIVPLRGEGRVETSDSLYRDAKKSFNDGNFELANKKFERFLLTYPEDKLFPSALYWAGKLKEKPAKALEYYNKIIDNYPNSEYAPYALYNIAQYEYIKGSYGIAAELYQKLITTYPGAKCISSAKSYMTLTSTLYTIQIGAFSDSSVAAATQKEFNNYNSSITEENGLFKLRIGTFTSADSAQQFMLENDIKGFVTKL